MAGRATLAEDSVGAIFRIPGAPSEYQLRMWVKLGYLHPVRKPTPSAKAATRNRERRGTYAAFSEEERFVAVVMARLARSKIPLKVAIPAARNAFLHPVGQHRVKLGESVYLQFATKADGSAPDSVVPSQRK